MKQHEFFKDVMWQDIEKAKIRMPEVSQRDPKSQQFDEIEPDSCDEDFQHEYTELC